MSRLLFLLLLLKSGEQVAKSLGLCQHLQFQHSVLITMMMIMCLCSITIANVMKSGRIPRLALTHFHLSVMLNVCENLENVRTAFLTPTLEIWWTSCQILRPVSTPSVSAQCLDNNDDDDDNVLMSYYNSKCHEIWQNPQALTNTFTSMSCWMYVKV